MAAHSIRIQTVLTTLARFPSLSHWHKHATSLSHTNRNPNPNRMSGDTWHMELLFPASPSSSFLHPYHIKEINITSIHVTDLTSSPESPGPRLLPHHGLWSVDRVSEIVIIMADPVSCWHLIVVHDRGGSWWWILILVDHDCGLWTIVAFDFDGGSWP